ncbi:hypothetical protein SDC9_123400 [bioreactor metagenome]|uniref:Uncharacterized protein n=2 Tax=root TaxID=1 RepID=A0A0J7IX20_9FLAO|nr:hypothetical protein [Chryseobacterium koreense]KMQ70359.1 hypothetical protein ACM44_12775 [Chryseobacterium koreense CCUG 49689]MBB5334661.1 hypothetical protein [Chryseobacterium koreense]
MKTFEQKPIGKHVFVTFWFIGTILLFAFYFSKSDLLLMFGIYYVILAVVINLLILLHEFLQAVNEFTMRSKYWISCLYILANLPITCLYLYIIFQIL